MTYELKLHQGLKEYNLIHNNEKYFYYKIDNATYVIFVAVFNYSRLINPRLDVFARGSLAFVIDEWNIFCKDLGFDEGFISGPYRDANTN